MPVSGEPCVRPVPEPIRITPVQTTDLLCPDLDLSVTLTPERPADRRHRQVRFNVSPKRRSLSESDPVVVTEIPEPRNIQSAIGNTREVDAESIPFDGQLTERAELNTTLALKAELREIQEQVFDREKAVKEKLQISSLTKNNISTRATDALNFPRSQHLYRALVNVNLSHEQLISQALRDRPTLAPPISSQHIKFASQPLDAPELQPFYDADKFLRETPVLPGDHIPLPRPSPAPRPAHTTFHLHHRHKLWES